MVTNIIYVSRNSKDKDRERYVAKGATLFSNSSKSKVKKKFSTNKKTIDLNFTSRQIPDEHKEKELFSKLSKMGIETNQYKKRYILRRIKARLSKLNLDGYGDYMVYITRNPQEIRELQESLSINVTRFFRNRDTYETLRDDILPILIKDARKNNRSEIKIWSAGCAVGAEPYSLAMIASDVVPSNMSVRVYASDIKEDLLTVARYGIYSDQYVAEMHPFEVSKYFNRNEYDEYIVKPHIKKLVSFTRIDLMKDNYPNNIDLILCRNVLIYIDRDAQNEIISKFFNSIRGNGMLVLGRTETLFVDWRKHINIVSTKHRIYQKIANTPNELPSLDFKESKRRFVSKENQSSHAKRLEELKNFRKTFENRKKQWEARIAKNNEETSKSAQKSDSIFSKNRIPIRNKPSINRSFTKNKSNPRKSINNSSETPGGLSSFRANLKKNPKEMDLKTMKKLVGHKSPEEVYNELKRIKKKKSRF